jgi:multiple sugar transport system substrate-binding protein
MMYYVPKLFTALGQAYERDHPGIKVKFIQASDMTGQDLSNVIASGNPPDLVYVFSSSPRYWAEKGVLVDLQEFITGDPQFKLNDVSDAALQLGKVTGKPGVYAIPARIETLGILYNKVMFAKAGLAEPAEGWTWDELIAGCEKIQATNAGVTCIEAGQPEDPGTWYPWVRGHGSDIFSSDGNQSTFSFPKTVESLRSYVEQWTKLKIFKTPEQNVSCFNQQKCAVETAWSSSIPWFRDQIGNHFEWGLQMMPVYPSGRLTWSYAYGFGISKSAKHPQEAWQFLKYLLSPEVQRQIVPAPLGLPVLKSVLAEPTTRNPAGYPVSMDAFIKGSESALFAPDYPAACGNLSLGEAQSASELAIQAPVKGWYKLEDALKQADERINKCLAATR